MYAYWYCTRIFFRLIFSWVNIEQVFLLYKDYDYMRWLSKKYYEQGDKVARDNFAISLDELVQPYSQKAFFNYVEKSTLYPNYMCRVSLAVQLSDPNTLTTTVRRGSPYFEVINYALLKRMESGFLGYLNVKHNGKKIPCPLEVKGSPLGSFKLFGAYALFFTGIGLSLIILIMENAHLRLKKYDLNDCDYDDDDDNESPMRCPTAFELALRDFCLKWGPDTRYYRLHFKQDLLDDMDKVVYSRILKVQCSGK